MPDLQPKLSDDWLQEAIKPYAECRAIAEDLAADAKVKFKDDPVKLEKARARYVAALGKAEGYLAKLETSIVQRKKKVDFKPEAQELGESVKALNDVVRPGTRVDIAGIGIAELIKGLLDGAIAIWREYRAQQKAEIDKLLELLKEKHWRTWDKAGS